MSQRWRAVANTVSDLTGPKFEPRTSRSRDERVTARPTGRYEKNDNAVNSFYCSPQRWQTIWSSENKNVRIMSNGFNCGLCYEWISVTKWYLYFEDFQFFWIVAYFFGNKKSLAENLFGYDIFTKILNVFLQSLFFQQSKIVLFFTNIIFCSYLQLFVSKKSENATPNFRPEIYVW